MGFGEGSALVFILSGFLLVRWYKGSVGFYWI